MTQRLPSWTEPVGRAEDVSAGRSVPCKAALQRKR